jgi:hypothetical protein
MKKKKMVIPKSGFDNPAYGIAKFQCKKNESLSNENLRFLFIANSCGFSLSDLEVRYIQILCPDPFSFTICQDNQDRNYKNIKEVISEVIYKYLEESEEDRGAINERDM